LHARREEREQEEGIGDGEQGIAGAEEQREEK
jgi:hypothetical protein